MRPAFPTPVGVCRNSMSGCASASSFPPRPWGCVDEAGDAQLHKDIFPTPVGCVGQFWAHIDRIRVLPTPVGVCRVCAAMSTPRPSSPRARGDVSIPKHTQLRTGAAGVGCNVSRQGIPCLGVRHPGKNVSE